MGRALGSRALRGLLVLVPVLAGTLQLSSGTASAAPTPVGLGTATTFGVLAKAAVTNVPTSSITGNVGLSPASGSNYAGVTCAQLVPPSQILSVDASGPGGVCFVATAGTAVTQPIADDLAAFTNTSNLPGATPVGASGDLAGLSLGAGLYSFASGATDNSGTLTLDAHGDPNSVWIFQASSSLITSVGSTMQFANLPAGVSVDQMACNVFWTVQSSATLTSTAIAPSNFIGTIMALADISVGSNATVHGRLLAGNNASPSGAVTLIMDTIIRPSGCTTLPAGTGGGPAAQTPAAPAAPPVPAPPRFTG